MVYSIEELKQRIVPAAEKYGLQEVYLFGSYARGEAAEQSDVDILINCAGSKVRGMFEMGGLYEDLCASVGKEVDLVTTQTLEQSNTKQRTPLFIQKVLAERIRLI